MRARIPPQRVSHNRQDSPGLLGPGRGPRLPRSGRAGAGSAATRRGPGPAPPARAPRGAGRRRPASCWPGPQPAAKPEPAFGYRPALGPGVASRTRAPPSSSPVVACSGPLRRPRTARGSGWDTRAAPNDRQRPASSPPLRPSQRPGSAAVARGGGRAVRRTLTRVSRWPSQAWDPVAAAVRRRKVPDQRTGSGQCDGRPPAISATCC
jgi:hypothetical protein